MKKNKVLFRIAFLFFSSTFILILIFFIIKSVFFYEEKTTDEENYVDYWLIKDKKTQEPAKINKLEKKSIERLSFYYIPKEIEKDITDKTDLLNALLKSKSFSGKIDNISLELNEAKPDVRWKMSDRTVKIFWLKEMNNEEFISVFTHEFSHYIDLYYLEKKVFTDISSYFYDISWESTKVVKKWLTQYDFVSWYAITNKYEDFAESMTYYILHNNEFLERSQKSEILKEKYFFFSSYIFKNNEFKNTSFSKNNNEIWYYRDITKMDINLKNFLQYLIK